MRRSERLLTAVCAALTLTVTLTAGCATVPSSGTPVDYTQVADPGNPVKQTDPEEGLGKLDIVRGFISANAGVDLDALLASARSFLAPSVKSSWMTVPGKVMILAASPRFDPNPDGSDSIMLSGFSDGYLRPDGSFAATARVPVDVMIGLTKIDGQWRISSPPDELILTAADFNSTYTQRQVFFLDHTGSVVVPDRRWLPNRTLNPVDMADLLISRLLAGPNPALAPAVRTELTGASLAKRVTASNDGVLQVDLTGLPTLSATNQRALAAQIVYSLALDASRIQITVDSAELDTRQAIWTQSVLGSFDPNGVPGAGSPRSQGYYLTAAGAMVDLAGAPVWGTAGTAENAAQSAAMSAVTGDLALVTAIAGGVQLEIGSPLEQQPMQARLPATSMTPPTFSRSGEEVWTVINGGTKPEVVRLLTSGSRYPVDSAALAGIGAITEFQLSPDGVRVALVADGKLYLSTVVYTGDDGDTVPGNGVGVGAGATLTAPQQIRSELTVGPVVWFDSQNLLLAGSDTTSVYRTVWRVGLDGRQRTPLSGRGILADVDSVASSPTQPTLISFGGRIYQVDGDDTSGDWVSAAPSGEPPPAGSWPFYPS